MTDLVERWKLAARRDDLFDHMVPSDVRQLVGEIERLRVALFEISDRCDEAGQIASRALENRGKTEHEQEGGR